MRRTALLSLCLVACHNESVGPYAAFEPQCGEDGPVELLRLDDGEEVGWVGRVNDEGDVHVVVTTAVETPEGTAWTWRSVVVDRCGDDVTELGTETHELRHWEEALVGCLEGDLVQLSSYDDPSPIILAQRGCATRVIGDRWITADVEPQASVGRLVSLEARGSEIVVRGLVEGIVVDSDELRPVVAVVDDRAFVQTIDLALRSVDPRTGQVTLELEEAQSNTWSASSSAIAYRTPVLDPERPDELMIKDRRTGSEQALDVELPTSWWLGWWADGLLTARPPGLSLGQRWFRLDPLRELVAPENTRIETVRAGGLVWLGRIDEPTGGYTLLRWHEGEAPEPAWTCTACGITSFPEGFLDVLVQTRDLTHYELWRLDDDGGPARLLADRIGSDYLVMDDEHVLTVLPGVDLGHGELALYEDPTQPSTLVPRVNRSAPLSSMLYDVPGELLYEATPLDGNTHALYRATLSLHARMHTLGGSRAGQRL